MITLLRSCAGGRARAPHNSRASKGLLPVTALCRVAAQAKAALHRAEALAATGPLNAGKGATDAPEAVCNLVEPAALDPLVMHVVVRADLITGTVTASTGAGHTGAKSLRNSQRHGMQWQRARVAAVRRRA